MFQVNALNTVEDTYILIKLVQQINELRNFLLILQVDEKCEQEDHIFHNIHGFLPQILDFRVATVFDEFKKIVIIHENGAGNHHFRQMK